MSLIGAAASAQGGAGDQSDRLRMLEILSLPAPPPPRPAGTSENHDEAKADIFPNLPDPLVLKNGQPVTTAAQWWNQRRAEIYEDMMTEVYGKIPTHTPAVAWEVTASSDNGVVKTKTILGRIDNSAHPALSPTIRMTLYTPSHATGPVPVVVEAITAGFGSGAPYSGPSRSDLQQLNQALKLVAEKADPATTEIFVNNPNYTILPPPPTPGAIDQVFARGWGYAVFDTGSVQPDSAAGLTQGIIGLMNRGQPRARPDEWGVLAAWAWGLSKAVDYFETDKDVDAKQLAVQGFSRWGKTAVLAAAIEPRWALAWAGDSGEGGTKIHRRDYGETVDDVALNFPYWMAGNFQKYAGRRWGDLPVDSHELVALVAPRPVFITGGTTDRHTDAKGMFLAAVGAGPVYRLLGKQDLGTAEMPAADVALIIGDLGYRMHTGGHTQAPDWPAFLEFAAKYLKTPAIPGK